MPPLPQWQKLDFDFVQETDHKDANGDKCVHWTQRMTTQCTVAGHHTQHTDITETSEGSE